MRMVLSSFFVIRESFPPLFAWIFFICDIIFLMDNENISSQEKSLPTKLLIFLVIILIAVSGYYFYSKKESYEPLTENPAPGEHDLTATQLYEFAKIDTASDISSEQGVEFSALPSEVASLINPKADSLSINKVKFSDGRAGYTIDYTVKSLIYQNQKFYSNLPLKGTVWKLVKAVHQNTLGITKLESETLFATVEATVVDSKSIRVSINVVNK